MSMSLFFLFNIFNNKRIFYYLLMSYFTLNIKSKQLLYLLLYSRLLRLNLFIPLEGLYKFNLILITTILNRLLLVKFHIYWELYYLLLNNLLLKFLRNRIYWELDYLLFDNLLFRFLRNRNLLRFLFLNLLSILFILLSFCRSIFLI